MRVESSRLTRAVTCTSAFFGSPQDRKPDAVRTGDPALPTKDADEKCSLSSSSTSSIGRNSDLSSETSVGDEDRGENEAQSAFSGTLDTMRSLEEVLPVSRGISKFYDGKSKSYTSLAIASSSPSVKDLAKPDNAYNKKRRNLMAFNHTWNKNRSRSFPLKSTNGGISKRPLLSSSRSALALAVAMNNSDASSITSEDSISNSTHPCLPPIHTRISASSFSSGGPSSSFAHNFSAWRSHSLADLQHCATTATIKMPSSSSLRTETALGKLS